MGYGGVFLLVYELLGGGLWCFVVWLVDEFWWCVDFVDGCVCDCVGDLVVVLCGKVQVWVGDVVCCVCGVLEENLCGVWLVLVYCVVVVEFWCVVVCVYFEVQ